MINYVPQEKILSGLKNCRVALVGAAESITDSGTGPEIDGHDVVVRINHGFVVPEELKPDLGSRTDLVYHCGLVGTPDGTGRHGAIENHFPGFRNLNSKDFQAMVRHRVRGVVFIGDPQSKRMDYLGRFPSKGISWSRFDGDFRFELQQQIGTLPNSGVVATAHLLGSELSELNLFGFDFFTTPHFSGYSGETEEHRVTAGKRESDQVHDQELQADFVGGLWSKDPRLSLPPLAEQKVRSLGWQRQ